ncbi:hypothetical protein HK405_011420, partial [Cladochytrium tenue]
SKAAPLFHAEQDGDSGGGDPVSPRPSSGAVRLTQQQFGPVAVACGLPVHLGYALFRAVVRAAPQPSAFLPSTATNDVVTNGDGSGGGDRGGGDSGGGDRLTPARVRMQDLERFIYASYWRHVSDLDALAFELLASDPAVGIVLSDFEILVQAETVIARLFYLNPSVGRTRMSLRHFRRLNLIDMLNEVEAAPSCLGASMPAPFSYKDFYVIYCKFWELDRDRDMLLGPIDLEFYGRRALSRAAVARVIECHGAKENSGHLGFKEFVNKTTDSALDYWFRVLDLDEDGALSLLELETFWEHQQHRLPEHYRIEDFFSLALDLVRPGRMALTLMDLRRSRLAAGLLLDMVLDSRRHVENLRRATDGAFRFRDEVWLEIEAEGPDSTDASSGVVSEVGAGANSASTSDVSVGAAPSAAATKRLRLDGWEKFSERAYRELANPSGSAASSARGRSLGSTASGAVAGGDSSSDGGAGMGEAGGSIAGADGDVSPENPDGDDTAAAVAGLDVVDEAATWRVDATGGGVAADDHAIPLVHITPPSSRPLKQQLFRDLPQSLRSLGSDSAGGLDAVVRHVIRTTLRFAADPAASTSAPPPIVAAAPDRVAIGFRAPGVDLAAGPAAATSLERGRRADVDSLVTAARRCAPALWRAALPAVTDAAAATTPMMPGPAARERATALAVLFLAALPEQVAVAVGDEAARREFDLARRAVAASPQLQHEVERLAVQLQSLANSFCKCGKSQCKKMMS